ncbi:hypothetical protein FOY51_14610 [Antrihabitans cavernicola]|uniref:DMT family transporter n=1 Tax=Antrihabitans cavernicola TaxID=2495913 RepID=A0A5A7SD12_9NOCA|nr:hypothetical protein FOY51_14610 [Spelaeibacter cavernicola]
MAIASALAAALCIALGAVLRQRVAAIVPDDEMGRFGVIGVLIRRPVWWAGTLVGIGGYVFQAKALGKGSLLLVQPLLVLSLLFALPLGAKFSGRTIRASEWVWAIVLTSAVAILVVVGDPRPGHPHAEARHWAIITGIGLPLVALCLIGAKAWPGARRALLLGVAAGALFGVAAVLTKGVVAHGGDGMVPLLTSMETYALIVVGLAATLLQQNAYQAGALQASLPATTVAEPVVATALGFLVLGEYLHTDKDLAMLLVGALIAMVAAAVALAQSTGESETDVGLDRVR